MTGGADRHSGKGRLGDECLCVRCLCCLSSGRCPISLKLERPLLFCVPPSDNICFVVKGRSNL